MHWCAQGHAVPSAGCGNLRGRLGKTGWNAHVGLWRGVETGLGNVRAAAGMVQTLRGTSGTAEHYGGINPASPDPESKIKYA
jgi:hypothetical protein